MRHVLTVATALLVWRVVRLLTALTRKTAKFEFRTALASNGSLVCGSGAHDVATLIRRAGIDLLVGLFIQAGELAIAAAQPAIATRTLQALLLGRVTDATSGTSCRCVADLQYGPHRRQVLDVYSPDEPLSADASSILFVHGGAWSWHSKDVFALVGCRIACALRARVAVMSYRAYPDGSCDDMTSDVDAALAWMSRWMPGRVVLTGHSAGAHLALLAFLQSHLGSETVGVQRNASNWRNVAAVVGIAGVYDISDHYRHEASRSLPLLPFATAVHAHVCQHMRTCICTLNGVASISPMAPAMRGAAGFDERSPTRLLQRAGAIGQSCAALQRVPVLLLHGDADETVPLSSSQRLHAAAAAVGLDVHIHALAGVGHADVLLECMTACVGTHTTPQPAADAYMAALRHALAPVQLKCDVPPFG